MKKILLALTMMAMGVCTSASAETVLKLGHFGSGQDPFSQSVEAFAQRVAELSNGDLTIKIYPGGQLGNERQEISALQGGLQELMITASTNLANMDPALSLLDLPFAFANHQEVDAVTLGPVGEKMMAPLADNGLVGLALWENGFRALTNAVRPINTVEDIKGLKIRVIGAPVFIDTFSALGANPVPMPFPELYSGLETGTVEGQDNPAGGTQAMKFYEVQKYFTPTNHIYGAMIVLGSKRALDRLSDKDREILMQAAKDFGVTQRKTMRDYDAVATRFLGESGGMIVSPALTPEALAGFRQATAGVVEKAVTPDLKPLYDEMEAAIAATGN
ncbi:TRAP transporter substrate-binding protein [Pseudodonghicola flavimaris]|uniref:DctP family TRAP transporter solute-binding subunit n=1 Tax=Pseudodonghicola flavimaris TaxID=3050036 RepID=A0ABT7F3L7_9RHOB|nr:DctP family TRAP transporter solute-binding subunit [Pseudodonghicola flavimaris]MDK3019203.1 DctP family TRAP transporter solute-binding subunit [Pseudodonghicola flavimaris]